MTRRSNRRRTTLTRDDWLAGAMELLFREAGFSPGEATTHVYGLIGRDDLDARTQGF
jgi:hypothetical protein